MGIKITLIQPQFGTEDVSELDVCTPSIGLAYIAAFLRNHGHNVTIIDAEVEQVNNEQTVQQAERRTLQA
jgi:hypothetical protein